MLEVTCYHCGQVVQISPDAERCSVCGMNLRKLIGRERASSYFYTRAANFAGAGNVLAALQEVQRGLAYVTSSELNLLGAILCKRLGRWDDMRHFVAAIPADDPLRGEGEWLLRSNQARQRPSPPPARGKAPVALPVIPDSDALPVVMDEVAPSPHHPQPARSGAGCGLATLVALTLVAVLAGAGWIAWENDLLTGLPLPGLPVAEQAAPQTADVPPNAPEATIVPAGLTTPQVVEVEPAPGSQGEAPAQGTTGAEDATDPASLFPTPTIAPNLADSAPISQAIASTSGDAAVAATNLNTLDWRAWLRQRERADLADLPVTVRVEDSTLILEGTVEYAEQRAALEFEAKQVPGVGDVSLVNVTLRPPQTYTVQEGDSLWAISVRIYGNADQVEELYAANRDQMTSAGDLSVGMVLAVPPVE
jgi:nucleoid-associated protein YgaU